MPNAKVSLTPGEMLLEFDEIENVAAASKHAPRLQGLGSGNQGGLIL